MNIDKSLEPLISAIINIEQQCRKAEDIIVSKFPPETQAWMNELRERDNEHRRNPR